MRYRAITISGLICSGKSSLFKSLQRELHWSSYSASQFFRQWSLENKRPLFEAEEEIKKREENLFEKWRKVYGRDDFLDPKFYDLAVDTTCLSKEEILTEVLVKFGD